MAEYIIQSETLTNIADPVRSLVSGEGELTPDQMAEQLNEANSIVFAQAELIEQIKSALDGKSVDSGLDTSDATATANKILLNETAYVNGEKVTGTLPYYPTEELETTLTLYSAYSPSEWGTNKLSIEADIEEDVALLNGSKIKTVIGSDSFGNADIYDVIKGKQFTSKHGLNIVGTIPQAFSYEAKVANENVVEDLYGTQDTISLSGNFESDICMMADSSIKLHADSALFGDAKPEDVLAGKTFTSGEGLKVTGNAIFSSGSGDSSSPTVVTEKDVNFIDYDGTLLYSYTVEEAQALTALPPLPSHDGLVCQGWNYDLTTIKEYNRDVTVGAMYTVDDGKTRIYIRLEEGRTSPMLGCCPNGTVTVDWGDGSATETLTGTSISTVQWTSNHDYASAGDYVITLSVNGSMGFYGSSTSTSGSGFLHYSSGADQRNLSYLNSVKKIEVGDGVTSIGNYAFYNCRSLTSITIPNSVTSIGNSVFRNCYSLAGITIPNSVTSIGTYFFYDCYPLASITIPNSVTSIGNYAFYNCRSLTSITIPNSVTSIGTYFLYNCYSLASITIPNGVTSIGTYFLFECGSLASATFLGDVTSIGTYALGRLYSARSYDFTNNTSVPTLSDTNTFGSIPGDCQIRVPSSLYDEWIAAENWSTYADYIVGV